MKAKAIIYLDSLDVVKDILDRKLRGKQVLVFSSIESGVEYPEPFPHHVEQEGEVVIISSPANRKKAQSNKRIEINLSGIYPNPMIDFDGETPLKINLCHDSVTITNERNQYIRLVIVG